MSHFDNPGGMAVRAWRAVEGNYPQCEECGAEQTDEDLEYGVCSNCEDAKFYHVNQGLELIK